MNAVYTYYDNPDMLTHSGFSNSKELARMMALSIEYSKKQLDKIKLVTTEYGKSVLIDRYNLPFDEVDTSLDQACKDLPKALWAYPKLYAYSIQDEPFIHVDNDVILFGTIPQSKRTLPLLFQNKEELVTHQGYKQLYTDYVKSGLQDPRIKPVDYACNCGIVLANDLNLIKEWHELVKEYLSHKDYWVNQSKKSGNNHFFEQYISSSLLHHYGINHGFIIDNFSYSIKAKDMPIPIVHLWGEAKRKPHNVKRVAERLYREYPQYKYIEDVQPEHGEVFNSIYLNSVWGGDSGGGSRKENTGEYRKFLHQFIKEKNIKSIADLGIGDFQVYSDMDFSCAYPDIVLKGYDISSVVLERIKSFENDKINFSLGDARKEKPTTDLVVIKDVMIHWSNQDIEEFVKDLPKSKYILVSHDIKDATEEDIVPGKFRPFDFKKKYDKAELVSTWDNGNKAIWIIEN